MCSAKLADNQFQVSFCLCLSSAYTAGPDVFIGGYWGIQIQVFMLAKQHFAERAISSAPFVRFLRVFILL